MNHGLLAKAPLFMELVDDQPRSNGASW
jgi:hypothetical protein